MAEFPALNLYTDAFMADTSHLGALETGAYMALLMASWRIEDGGLPDDDVMLARMARCTPREWKRVRQLVMPFWTMCQDAKWRQKRLEIERETAREKSQSAGRAAKARWLKNNKLGDADAERTQCEGVCESHATTSTSTSIREDPPSSPPTGGATMETPNVPKRGSIGTRLDPDWHPTAEDRAYAEGLGLNPDVVGEEFRNFWVGVPGAKGRKLDWPATFRNRCIQLAGTARPRNGGHHAGAHRTRIEGRGDGIVAAAERVMRRRGLVDP